MDDYLTINLCFNLFLFCLTVVFIYRRDRNSLVDNGDTVLIRSTIFSRLLNLGAKSVKKSDIVKIQLAGKCVSLFNKSNHAYDIFIVTESVKVVFNQAKEYFPSAKVVEIKC